MVVVLELETRRALADAIARLQRGGELLHEERHALRAVVHRSGQRRRRPAAEHARGELGARRLVERRHHDLAQQPAAAQVGAQAPQRMAAADLVRAVGGDDQQREVAQRRRERGEQFEGRAVGPLQVVEQHERGRERAERAADRLEHRGAIAGRAPADRAPAAASRDAPAAARTRRARTGRCAAPAQRRHHGSVGGGAAAAGPPRGGAALPAAPPPRGGSFRLRPHRPGAPTRRGRQGRRSPLR